MRNKIVIPFVASFILLVVVIALNRTTYDSMQSYKNLVSQTRDIIIAFKKLSMHLKSAEVYTPTYENIPENAFYLFYKKELNEIDDDINELKNLTYDRPHQKTLIDSIEKLISTQLPVLVRNNIAELIKSGEGKRLDTLFLIHHLIERGVTNEQTLLNKESAELESSTHQNNILSIFLSFIAIAIVIAVFFTNLFITKKKIWLEDFLSSIINTSQNGIVYYKPVKKQKEIIDFKINFSNKVAEELVGFEENELKEKLLSTFTPFINKNLFENFIDVVHSGNPSEVEVNYKKDDIDKHLIISLAKLEEGVTAAFYDISKLKGYEDELMEKISELEVSNMELEQYAFAASHDLQEPLRKIKTFGSILQQTQSNNLDERGKQHLSKMLFSAGRMSMLIRDLITFSGLRTEIVFEQVDLEGVFQDVLNDLQNEIAEKKAVIKSEPLPVIEANKVQMHQLFINIINNSLKFSKEGEELLITITCKPLEKTSPDNGELLKFFEITFSDNGIGFNPEYATQIFGLFKRLHDRRSYIGSGVGLALCKKVVHIHHGEIYAKGDEGVGASFYVILPERQIVL